MKLREHPLFIYCSVILFYPVGLLILLKSTVSKGKKIVLALLGGILFVSFLLLPQIMGLHNQNNLNDFDVVATRKVLTVGQSAGFAIYNDEDYYASFQAECDNEEVLQMNGNLYTAKSVGSATITVTFADQERRILVTVIDGADTSEIVFITPSGTRYHQNKKHAGENAISVTEEDALMSSKTPCKICYSSLQASTR